MSNMRPKSQSTHQNHYVKDLSEIPTSHLDMKDLDKEVDADTHALYWSLLGGIAWLLQTRADICPFVGFLQRAAQKPLIRHVRLLNRVLRYVRRVPSGILFQRLEPPVRLVVVADAAYKAKPDAQECLALRGYIIMLVGSNATTSQYPGGVCNVLDYVSKKFQQVARSSFVAELRNQVEAAQVGSFFSAFMQENLMPNLTAMKLTEISDHGSYHLKAMVLGDNDGVWRAVTAENPRTPTEPALTPHVRAYREMLDTKAIQAIGWVDNRDMVADPLTKGKTQRNIINWLLNFGIFNIKHPVKLWPEAAVTGPRDRASSVQK